jgi:hypothetical protein
MARSEVRHWHGVDEVQWLAACDRLHTALGEMYPPEWHAAMDALRRGDASGVAPALDFLQADAHCFRSGYEKERVCRFLARCELTRKERARLVAVIDRVRTGPARPGRERRAFERLAARLGI